MVKSTFKAAFPSLWKAIQRYTLPDRHGNGKRVFQLLDFQWLMTIETGGTFTCRAQAVEKPRGSKNCRSRNFSPRKPKTQFRFASFSTTCVIENGETSLSRRDISNFSKYPTTFFNGLLDLARCRRIAQFFANHCQIKTAGPGILRQVHQNHRA